MNLMVSYTMVCGRMKGATWGHIWHIDRAAATAGSILLSQGYIFQQQREYIAESGVYIFNCKGVYC